MHTFGSFHLIFNNVKEHFFGTNCLLISSSETAGLTSFAPKLIKETQVQVSTGNKTAWLPSFSQVFQANKSTAVHTHMYLLA